MATEVIFSFDTEDFTSHRNSDAVLGLATMLTEEGVIGHFGVVGLVAEQLMNSGRQDVIEALQPHILGFHSWRHTVHPTMAEVCDREDADAASAELEVMEQNGLDLLRRAFGDKPIMFAVPPGSDVTFNAQYFYERMGIPFYFGGFINDADNSLIDYCGMIQIPYTVGLEDIFLSANRRDPEAVLDELSKFKRVIIFHHPNLSVKKVFWDALNYNGRNQREFGDWVDAPDRTFSETITFWHNCRMLIRRLRQDPRFVITDVNRILAERKEHLAGPIRPKDLPSLIAELNNGLAPLKSAAYSVADVFHAAAVFLQGKDLYEIGPVKGFLEEPHGIEQDTTVSAAAVRAEAQKITAGKFIPANFIVDGQRIGAADMLFAMAEALDGSKEQITLKPRRQTVDVSELEMLSTLNLKGMWLFSPELEDKYLSRRLRLQAWTWREYGI